MNHVITFLLLLLTLTQDSRAQNLVPNWQFDSLAICIPRLTLPGDPYGAAEWAEDSTADFYHWNCQGPLVGAPACQWGYFPPETGMAGLIAWNWSTYQKEAIKCRLNSPVNGWLRIRIRAQSAQQFATMASALMVIIGQDTAHTSVVSNRGQWLDFWTAGNFQGDSLKIMGGPPSHPFPGHTQGFAYILIGEVWVERLTFQQQTVAPIK